MDSQAEPQVRRFGVSFSENRSSADQAASTARALMQSRGAEVYSLSQVLDGQEVECLISIGGDGTLLHAARLMAPRAIPVLGVNFGHVGYLCAAREDQLELAINAMFDRKYTTDKRSLLRARVFNRREEVWQVDALNEILVGGSTRTLALELSLNGEDVGVIKGDGIIVSTRTGSTAYAFSAGGPILLTDALVLVASNPVASSIATPVVCPVSTVFRIRNLTQLARPYVIADGQKDYQIDEGTVIEMTVSPIQAHFADPGLVSSVGKLSKSVMQR